MRERPRLQMASHQPVFTAGTGLHLYVMCSCVRVDIKAHCIKRMASAHMSIWANTQCWNKGSPPHHLFPHIEIRCIGPFALCVSSSPFGETSFDLIDIHFACVRNICELEFRMRLREDALTACFHHFISRCFIVIHRWPGVLQTMWPSLWQRWQTTFSVASSTKLTASLWAVSPSPTMLEL